ncbi:hypothetical protein COU74_02280 [Candidatus Peregrinibacteria bacterium CG10_big_fil_rev_8_21_14_0_10_36_19]|nr:MAG: hypothetical protein COU74_02280 [Candidatus Peregrinibacteria bacterium CG10_big_fil_rev_8_21_14_0_10_36_19]
MSDENSQAQGGQQSSIVNDVVVDKNKTAEQYILDVEDKYIVPPLIREKFSDLIKLIYETESMDKEEREYWLQIMPIMSEDQIVKFREILVTEKDQLAALDQKYATDMAAINKKQNSELDEEEMKKKLKVIKDQEVSSEAAEKLEEEKLLKELETL